MTGDDKIVNTLKNCIGSQTFDKDWCSLKDVWEASHVVLEKAVRKIIWFLETSSGAREGEGIF